MAVSAALLTSASDRAETGFKEAGETRATILLVEDDEIIRSLLLRILDRLSFDVVWAATGHEGEALLQEHSQHVVLAMVDCWLPDTDGQALCRRLRRLAPGLPVLLTSGMDGIEVAALAEDGPAAFLQKPFFPAQVAMEIGRLTGAIA